MRHAAFLLVWLALPASAMAQLEFLTVREIFDMINFLVAHPASPTSFITVSPFGPELDETRMPETFADLSTSVLHCYHHAARYQLADIIQTPWDRQGQYGGDNSALIRIRYAGAGSSDLHEMNVGLVSRRDELRTVVLNDNSPNAWDANCPLEKWTTLKP